MNHPHELLAEYVDGALNTEDAARVESHIASCASCAQEVTLANEAATAVGSLPEEQAPFGLAQRALREAARPRTFARPIVWKIAGAAAAAAVVAGAFVFFGGGGRTGRQAAAPTRAEEQPEATATLESAGEDAVPAGSPQLAWDASRAIYPAYSKANRDYTPETVNARMFAIAADAQTALQDGFPATAQAFYAAFALDSLPKPAQTALECVNRGVPPDRTVVPFVIEDARFEGAPAHLVTYLRGETAADRYDRLQLLVANRATCAILHFARQRL